MTGRAATVQPGTETGGPAMYRSVGFWAGLAVVIAVAGVLRVVSYHDMSRSPLLSRTPFLADAVYYDYRAKCIAGGDWVGREVFFMAPLYEYAVALPYWLTGQSIPKPDYRLARRAFHISPAIYVQCAAGALTCGLLYVLAWGWFGRLAGWAAGLMAAFYGPFIFFDGLLMAASLVLLTGVVAIVALSRADRRYVWHRWLVAGATVGLASLAHGSMLALAPVVVLVMIVWVRNTTRRRAVACAGWFTLGTALMILPVTVRNYVAGEDFVLLTSNAGMNFFIGNNAHANGTHIVYQYPYAMTKLSDYYQRPRRQAGDPAPSFVSRQVARRAWSWITSHPADAAGLWLTKLRLWFNRVELGIRDQYYFFRPFSRVLRLPLFSFAVIGPLGLTGAVFMARSIGRLRFVYLVLAVQTFVFVLMFVLGRYRFCATACLMLLGAGQLAWWWRRIRQRDYRRLAVSMGVLAAFALLVNIRVNGFDENYGAAKLYASLGSRYLAQAIADRDPRRLDDAIQAFERAEKLDWGPGGLSVSKSRMLMRAGDAWLARGDLDKARAYGQKALDQIDRELQSPPADYAPVRPSPDQLHRRARAVGDWITRIGKMKNPAGGGAGTDNG